MPQIPSVKLPVAEQTLLNFSGFVQISEFLLKRYFDDAGRFPIVMLPREKKIFLSAWFIQYIHGFGP